MMSAGAEIAIHHLESTIAVHPPDQSRESTRHEHFS
jgi:hypothetical protein